MNDLIEKPYFTNSAVSKAASVDAILIGGGDLIRVESISPLYWNGAWTSKPIVVSGIGVAEESKTVRADVIPRLQRFLGSNNILSLSARDERSAAWINHYLKPAVPARTVPDLVFAKSEGSERQDKSGRRLPKVGFVFNKTHLTDSDLNFWNHINAANAKGQIFATILVLATGDQREKEVDNLQRNGLYEYAEEFEDTGKMIDRLRDMDLVVSAKFHALVVASKYRIPYISLRDTSKSIALARYSSSEAIPRELDDLLEPIIGTLSRSNSVQCMTTNHVRDLANAEISHVTGLMNAIDRLRLS